MIQGPPTLLAAWGGLVRSRPYLRTVLAEIFKITDAAGAQWVSLGESTKDGHPRHPLYVRADTPLVPFDTAGYLETARI